MQVVTQLHVRVHIEQLIKDSKKALVLISPYIDLWGSLEREIVTARARGVNITVVARGGKDLAKQLASTATLREAGIRVLFLDRLHAKLYASESTAILSSMNLLKSSQEASWEAAVIFDKAGDPEGYVSIAKAIHEIGQAVEDEQKRIQHARVQGRENEVTRVLFGYPPQSSRSSSLQDPPTPGPVKDYGLRSATRAAAKGKTKSRKRSAEGSCIRCKGSIKLNAAKPLCPTCYQTWAKFGDEDFVEPYCHGCGKKHAGSVRKPMCRACWSAGTG